MSASTPFDMYATQGRQSMTDLPDALPAQATTVYLRDLSALLSLMSRLYRALQNGAACFAAGNTSSVPQHTEQLGLTWYGATPAHMLCSRRSLSCLQPSDRLPSTALAVSVCHQPASNTCSRLAPVPGQALRQTVVAPDPGLPHGFRDVLRVLQRHQPVQGLVHEHGMLLHIAVELEAGCPRGLDL